MTVRIEYLADRKDLLPELAQLHFAEWGHFRPDQTLEDRVESLKRCCGRGTIPNVLVATNSGTLLGSAMLVAQDMSIRKNLSPWLAGVFVKSSYRKAGIATKLVERVERDVLQLNLSKLYLYTDKEEKFYCKRGWQTIEACEYKGLHVKVMSKELVA